MRCIICELHGMGSYDFPHTPVYPYKFPSPYHLYFPAWQALAGKMTRKVVRQGKPAIKVFRKSLWNSELVVEGSTRFWIDRLMPALVMLSASGIFCPRVHIWPLHLLEMKTSKKKRQLIWEGFLKMKEITFKTLGFFLWENRKSPKLTSRFEGTWFLITLYYPLY